MHPGKNSLNYTYMKLGSELAITTQKRDLGVTLDSSLKKISSICNSNKKIQLLDIIMMKIENRENQYAIIQIRAVRSFGC